MDLKINLSGKLIIIVKRHIEVSLGSWINGITYCSSKKILKIGTKRGEVPSAVLGFKQVKQG